MDEAELRARLEGCHRESYGWALCCCGRDAQRAEEVLQRAYLAVLERPAAYRGQADFRTWLFGVIRKTAADERRRDWLRRLRLVRWGQRGGAAAAAEPPGNGLERDERQALFMRILDGLPARQRQVLHLVFYQGLTVAEAGAVLGIAAGSARVHYARAKAALQRQLKDTVFDETGPRTRALPVIA